MWVRCSCTFSGPLSELCASWDRAYCGPTERKECGMKKIVSILAATTVAAICVGIPVHQASADPPVRSGDELAGKFLLVNTRQAGALLQNATVRRLGNREFLGGECIPLTGDAPEWRGTAYMIPIDQIDSVHVFDDRDKLIKLANDRRAEAARRVPPIYEVPPTRIDESKPGIEELKPVPDRIK